MRQILEIEEHVTVPPMMYSDPFYRISYLIKQEIRKHKWIEGEKGRHLSWKEARAEWTKAHRKEYEKFLLDTLSFPNLVPSAEQPSKTRRRNSLGGAKRSRCCPTEAARDSAALPATAILQSRSGRALCRLGGFRHND
jgi:hypothetical protein